MIFEISIAQYMCQAMDLQSVMMKDTDIQNYWLSLLKKLLSYEFDNTFEMVFDVDHD